MSLQKSPNLSTEPLESNRLFLHRLFVSQAHHGFDQQMKEIRIYL